MTAQHIPEEKPIRIPMTVDEFMALPEDEVHRWELMEGTPVMSPRPLPRHQYAGKELDKQLSAQIPERLLVLGDLDVDLELAKPDEPGFVRCPDLIVVDKNSYKRVDFYGEIFRASDILLAVEIVSRGSKRTDSVVKRDEYSDAGIPHYWIVDIQPPVSLLAYHQAGSFGYMGDGTAVTETFTTEEPFPVTIDLGKLRMDY